MKSAQRPPACNCMLMRQATRHISALYDRHLEQAGLTTSQFGVMSVIHGRPGISMNELAEYMMMDRTTLVRAIQPLSRDGLLQQLPSAESRRRLSLSLTDAGSKKYAEAHVHWQAAQQEFEAFAGAAHVNALRSELINLVYE